MTGRTFSGFLKATIEIDSGNSVFGFCESYLVDFERNSLLRYFGSEKDILIGKQFAGIDNGCFHLCHEISAVQFEAGSEIAFLGDAAFCGCSGLTLFLIPATVETIGTDCFTFCNRLETVAFETGSRIAVIGATAFSYCRSLQSIAFPASLTTIGVGCFYGCGCLATVTVESDSRMAVIGKNAFCDCASLLKLPKSIAELL
jgi:hypothetical protein